jgi:hypothetical protein
MGAAVLGAYKFVANVVGSMRLNLNPHPLHIKRVRHPTAVEGIEFESGDILLA